MLCFILFKGHYTHASVTLWWVETFSYIEKRNVRTDGRLSNTCSYSYIWKIWFFLLLYSLHNLWEIKRGCEYNKNLKCFLLVFHTDYEESEHCRIFFIINWQMLWVFNLQNSQLLLMNNKMLSFVCHVGMEEASIDCRNRVM